MTDHWERPEQSGQAKIALVDDNADQGGTLANGLRRLGYSVAFFDDPDLACQSFRQILPDLALLDLSTPARDGYQVMKALHSVEHVPVIFMSPRHDEPEHVRALRAGADDFVVKPVTLRLLNARIDALLRRRVPQPVMPEQAGWALARGGLEMAPDLHAARWNGINLRLTATEFTILHALAEKPGYVRSRGYLKSVAYGDAERVNDRTIDSHIKRLRAKLRRIGGETLPIDTVYGLGYRFRVNLKADAEAA